MTGLEFLKRDPERPLVKMQVSVDVDAQGEVSTMGCVPRTEADVTLSYLESTRQAECVEDHLVEEVGLHKTFGAQKIMRYSKMSGSGLCILLDFGFALI